MQVKWNVDKTTDRCPLGHVHATEGAAFAAALDTNICIPEPARLSASSINIGHRTVPPRSPKRVQSETTHTATQAPKSTIIGGPRPNQSTTPKVLAEPEPPATLQSESAILSPSTNKPRTRAQTALDSKPPPRCRQTKSSRTQAKTTPSTQATTNKTTPSKTTPPGSATQRQTKRPHSSTT